MRKLLLICGILTFAVQLVSAEAAALDPKKYDKAAQHGAAKFRVDADQIMLKPNQRTMLRIIVNVPPSYDEDGNPKITVSFLPIFDENGDVKATFKLDYYDGPIPNYENAPYKPGNWRIVQGGGTLSPEPFSLQSANYIAPAKAVGDGSVVISVEMLPQRPGLAKYTLLKTLQVGQKNGWVAKVEFNGLYTSYFSRDELKRDGDRTSPDRIDTNKTIETTIASFSGSSFTKLLRHDGFISDVGGMQNKSFATSFGYRLSQNNIAEINRNDSNNRETIRTTYLDQSVTPVNDGNVFIEWAEQGESLLGFGLAASGKGKITHSLTEVRRSGTQTSTDCGDCLREFSFKIDLGDMKPPSRDILELPAEARDAILGDHWQGSLKITGSINEGRFVCTYTGKRQSPAENRTENSGSDKTVLHRAETIIVRLTVILQDKID